MCSPVLGAVAIGAEAGSGLYSAIQAKAAGNAKADYNHYLADSNRQMATLSTAQGDQQSNYIQDVAAREALNQVNKGKQIVGTQTAQMAANGVSLDSATAEDVIRNTMNYEHQDEQAIRFNADSQAWAARNEAANKALAYNQQANGYDLAADNASSEGTLNMINTLMGSARSIGQDAYAFNQAGLFKTKAAAAAPSNAKPAPASGKDNSGRFLGPIGDFGTGIGRGIANLFK